MYTWDDDTSSWYGSGKYAYSPDAAERRRDDAARAAAVGPRTYSRRGGPNPEGRRPEEEDPSDSKNPLIVAVDVTGSMASWPFEIFDRLPLLYNTLSQYREDLRDLLRRHRRRAAATAGRCR